MICSKWTTATDPIESCYSAGIMSNTKREPEPVVVTAEPAGVGVENDG